MHFEIKLIFLIKLFLYTSKKSRQKVKYPENKKSFKGEVKSIFHQFEGAFSCQKLSQTWKCVFNCFICFLNICSKCFDYMACFHSRECVKTWCFYLSFHLRECSLRTGIFVCFYLFIYQWLFEQANKETGR